MHTAPWLSNISFRTLMRKVKYQSVFTFAKVTPKFQINFFFYTKPDLNILSYKSNDFRDIPSAVSGTCYIKYSIID